MVQADIVTLFDGVCDQTKKLQTLSSKFDDDDFKWIISSSGHNMFVKFDIGTYGSSIGFVAKIHYVDCNSVSKNDTGFSACFSYGVNEGPCVVDDECKDNLFCGSNNCPDSLGVLSSIDCCEAKGN